jgi:hypothetical protein
MSEVGLLPFFGDMEVLVNQIISQPFSKSLYRDKHSYPSK